MYIVICIIHMRYLYIKCYEKIYIQTFFFSWSVAFLLFFKRDDIWWTGKQQASSSFILFIVHVYCSVPHKYYFTSRSKTFLLEFLCLDFTSSSLTYFPWIFLCIVWRSDWGSLFFFVYEYPINPILFENICVCLYIYIHICIELVW